MNAVSPYQEAVQVVTRLTIGDRATVSNDHIRLLRTAAGEKGIKLSLIERRADGLAVIQRVEETRWGATKARVAVLEIGESITAPFSKKESYFSAARSMGMFLRAERVSSAIVLLTRVAQSVRANYGEIKQMLVDLPAGCGLADQELRRAKNLCTAGCNLGFSMSRQRQPDGNYTVTRLA